MLGGTLSLTYADKRGGGGQKSENLADIICERSLLMSFGSMSQTAYVLMSCMYYSDGNFGGGVERRNISRS